MCLSASHTTCLKYNIYPHNSVFYSFIKLGSAMSPKPCMVLQTTSRLGKWGTEMQQPEWHFQSCPQANPGMLTSYFIWQKGILQMLLN